MQPVQWLNSVDPWDAPQYLPGQPHNLPSRPDPAVAGSTVRDIPASGLEVRESYRFASINTVSLTVDTTSIKFLDAPIGKRNFLGFRNASTGGQNLFVEFNSQASTGSWLKITPGTIVVFDTVVSQDDLYVIADAAGAVFAYAYSTYPG